MLRRLPTQVFIDRQTAYIHVKEVAFPWYHRRSYSPESHEPLDQCWSLGESFRNARATPVIKRPVKKKVRPFSSNALSKSLALAI